MTPQQRALIAAASSRLGAHAVAFSSPQNLVILSTVTPFLSLTAFTVEAWVFCTATDGTNSQFIVRFRNGNVGIEFRLNSATNDLSFVIGNGTTSTFCTSATAVPVGQWVHVAGSYDASNMRVFINGAVGATTALASANTGNPAISMGIGNSFVGSTTPFHGLIQELRISNTARYTAAFTPSQVPFIPDTNTLGLFHMSEGSGVTAFDSSSNKLKASFAGNPPPHWDRGRF